MLKRLIYIFVVYCSVGITGVYAQVQTLVASDVVAKYVNGELRFCEQAQVKGLICYGTHTWSKKSMPRDWWRAETYVQAVTGLNEFILYEVGIGPDGRSVFIRFSR